MKAFSKLYPKIILEKGFFKMKRTSEISKLNKKTSADYIMIFIMVILAFITVYPFYNILILSFNDAQDAMRGGIYFWVRKFTLSNYILFFESNDFLGSFTLSVSRTVIGSLSATFFTAMFAYVLSKKYLLGHKVLVTLMMIPMYVGGGLIPTFLLIKSIGLYQNFLVFIIPWLFSSYNCIIMMTYFRGLPEEIEESAKIDGANNFIIFIKIIIPISMPVIATIILFNAVGQWNSWYDSMLYGGQKLVTLQMRLVQLIRDAEIRTKMMQTMGSAVGNFASIGVKPTVESVKVTAMAVTVIPIMMVYPFLQKYFVKGIMIGSIKG